MLKHRIPFNSNFNLKFHYEKIDVTLLQDIEPHCGKYLQRLKHPAEM